VIVVTGSSEGILVEDVTVEGVNDGIEVGKVAVGEPDGGADSGIAVGIGVVKVGALVLDDGKLVEAVGAREDAVGALVLDDGALVGAVVDAVGALVLDDGTLVVTGNDGIKVDRGRLVGRLVGVADGEVDSGNLVGSEVVTGSREGAVEGERDGIEVDRGSPVGRSFAVGVVDGGVNKGTPDGTNVGGEVVNIFDGGSEGRKEGLVGEILGTADCGIPVEGKVGIPVEERRLGDAVGVLVGASEGALVGVLVGMGEGAKVGVLVGMGEGAKVGVLVGVGEGALVGVLVGGVLVGAIVGTLEENVGGTVGAVEPLVGAKDGLRVVRKEGENVGTFDGLLEGAFDILIVGNTLGNRDGRLDGEAAYKTWNIGNNKHENPIIRNADFFVPFGSALPNLSEILSV